ncbi:MoaD/ThiS family protein [Geoglobus acetivorans]|uniref:Molybdenum cofactor biosynthesis protein MoaD n=1 Tax=Geoglobus acetivorans TaxID=565033 RepID=A0A0A7GFG7_GEOAI|nr:Molybdenum cofactor biosynthesis protein MoaD [Geoglobus acetivorans]
MVRVKFFANFREVAGTNDLEIEAKTLEELLENLKLRYPGMEKLYSYAIIMVNGRQAKDTNLRLESEDVVALLPPVSGG